MGGWIEGASLEKTLLRVLSIFFFTVEALEQHLGKPWKLLAAVALGYPAHVPKGPWNGRPRKSVDEVAEFFR